MEIIMDKADPIYHRPELAQRLAAMLLGNDPLSAAGRSGLFLSAPRRTGKSTFLRNDLIPAVEKAGAIAIYVDLWTDKTRDAADLIAEAIRDALASHSGRLARGLRALQRIKKAGAKGELAGFKGEFGFELDTIGEPQGTALAKALEALYRRVEKPIVLIIDEAQHALSTERGADTLFALKAARDALNLTAETPRLAIVATGSARGKIADMVMRRNQAFYGASVETFPPLGESFVQHLVSGMLSHRLSKDRIPAAKQLMQAFQTLGSRPEDLRRAVRDALVRPEADLTEAIVAAAQEQRGRILEELRKQLSVLNSLQRAILKRMVKLGDGTQPFSQESVEDYRNETGNHRVTKPSVQKALDVLVANHFVWRSSRGVYALDDVTVAEFFYDEAIQEALLRELDSRAH
jgi:hypothetical protein